MIRIIIFALFIFLFYLIGKIILKLLFQPRNTNNQTFQNKSAKQKRKSSINKEDIIDADFEELDDKNK